MAIDVAPTPSTLTVRLSGWDRVLALKGRLEIPVDRILDVTVVDRSEVGWPPWLRAPGTFVPGAIKHGSYGIGAKREFWAVFRQDRVLVIRIGGWDYARVVLGLDNADLVAMSISTT